GATAKASSGFWGSLTAKLAVTGAVILGTGYAVLGSRAHGSPHGASAPLVPAPSRTVPGVPVRDPVLLRAPFGVTRAHVHTRAGHPNRTNTTSHPRPPRQASAPLRTRVVASPEFGPERASAAASLASTARSSREPPPTPAEEFGPE
ncbi:MAG: hypothetical protein WBV85_07055, partial [Solirubrobacteraceae bacterium]